VAKYDLAFSPPLMNAAGALGFVPDRRGQVPLDSMGAFVTNPISRQARTPAAGQRYLESPGGFLLHTGHANPGFKTAVNRYARQWAHLELPVIVHLLAQEPADLVWMVERLEGMEGLMGIEIGLPPQAAASQAAELVNAAWSELPVIVRLPMERASQLAWSVVQAGAAAVSLSAPRGALPARSGGLLSGRLYGPAVYPLALQAVRALAAEEIPVIGAGGIYSPDQGREMLLAGALAVQLDAVLWSGRDLLAFTL
jgi:dihydroorotate dehydrogenase (NAD+) catalytic subunit